MKNLKTYVYA